MAPLPTVCILAGGVGSRLGDRVREIPKPLLPVAGEPFLVHQLRLLRSHGAERAVLCVGYLGEQIEAELGSECEGVALGYSYDGPALVGTAGAIRQALPALGGEFLVLYGDTYLRIDYQDVVRAHRAAARPALMTVLENAGRWDTSNAEFAGDLVVRYDKRSPTPDMRWIDYGLGVLTPDALSAAPQEPDLAEVYAALSVEGRLTGYPATERFFEIGTPDALSETERYLSRLGA